VMNAPYGLSRPDKLTEHLIKVVRIDYVWSTWINMQIVLELKTCKNQNFVY
jgi:hypothetical protein